MVSHALANYRVKAKLAKATALLDPLRVGIEAAYAKGGRMFGENAFGQPQRRPRCWAWRAEKGTDAPQ